MQRNPPLQLSRGLGEGGKDLSGGKGGQGATHSAYPDFTPTDLPFTTGFKTNQGKQRSQKDALPGG